MFKKAICSLMFNKYTEAIPELLFRIVVGVIFFESGLGKFKSIESVVSYFESLGIPYAYLQAPFVSGVELIAGGFLIFGAFTRISSFLLMQIMLVALITAKKDEIATYSDLFGLSEFLYFAILTSLFFYGSKCFSVDFYFRKGFCRRK